jgi:hypothetical protein
VYQPLQHLCPFSASHHRQRRSAPVLQAIFNVTRDATRVADLLEDFFAQQQREAHGDPGLRDKFMAYMAAQANTSYSVVDNQLSWVLWLYSMIWMPLLVVMCFMRASRSAQQHGGGSSRGSKAEAAAAHQQGLLRSASTASTPYAAASAASSGLLLLSESIGGSGQQRQELLGTAAAAAAVGQRTSSSGGWPEAAAGPGRGLRRYASVASQQLQQQQQSGFSDSKMPGHLLAAQASLPAHLLVATGSSSSSLKGLSGGSSSKLDAYRLAASAADGDLQLDVGPAADQLSRQRRSSKATLQRGASSLQQSGWQLRS